MIVISFSKCFTLREIDDLLHTIESAAKLKKGALFIVTLSKCTFKRQGMCYLHVFMCMCKWLFDSIAFIHYYHVLFVFFVCLFFLVGVYMCLCGCLLHVCMNEYSLM